MDKEFARHYLEDTEDAMDLGEYFNRDLMHHYIIRQWGFHYPKYRDDSAPIAFYEFGVRAGSSFVWWVAGNNNPDSTFVGFDSFEGLPEEWEGGLGIMGPGAFSRQGRLPPIDDPRITWVPGWFEDTLPPYKFRRQHRSVYHIDCDLYSSTVTVLDAIKPNLRFGDYIIFDDAGLGDEWKAFIEADIPYKPIMRAGCAVAVEVRP